MKGSKCPFSGDFFFVWVLERTADACYVGNWMKVKCKRRTHNTAGRLMEKKKDQIVFA